MAGGFDRKPEDFSIVNAMLPRKYYPAWQGNIYELRTASIAEQLCGPDMEIDYDQLLAKRPKKGFYRLTSYHIINNPLFIFYSFVRSFVFVCVEYVTLMS